MVILAAARIGNAKDGDTYGLCEMEGRRLRISLINAFVGQVSSLGHWEMSDRILSVHMAFFPKLEKLLVIVRLPSELRFAWLLLSPSSPLPASATNAFASLLPSNELAESPCAIPVPVLCAASQCRMAIFLPGKGIRISEEIKSTSVSFVSSPATWTTEHSQFKNYFAVDNEMVVEAAQSSTDESVVLLHTVDMLSQLPSISWGEIEWTKNKLRIQWRAPLLCHGACISMLSGKAVVGCADRLLLVNASGVLRDLPMPGNSRVACLAPLFFAKAEHTSSVLVGDSDGRLLRCETDGAFKVHEVALVLSDPFDLQPSTAMPFDRLLPLSGMESLSRGVLVVVGSNALGSALLCSNTAAERVPALVQLAGRLRSVHSLLPAVEADDEASPDSAMLVSDGHAVHRLACGLLLSLEQSQTMDLGAAATDARILCSGEVPGGPVVVTSRAFRCSAVVLDPDVALCGDEETLAVAVLSEEQGGRGGEASAGLLQVTPRALVVVSRGHREARRTSIHQLLGEETAQRQTEGEGPIRFAVSCGHDTVRLFLDRHVLSVQVVRGEPHVMAAKEALPGPVSAVAACASIVAYACWDSTCLYLEQHLPGGPRTRRLPLDWDGRGERLVRSVAVQVTAEHVVLLVAAGSHALCFCLDRQTAFPAVATDVFLAALPIQRINFPAPVHSVHMHPKRVEALVVTCSTSLYLCAMHTGCELRVAALRCGRPGQSWGWAGEHTLCSLGVQPGSSLADLLYHAVPSPSATEKEEDVPPHTRTHSWRSPTEPVVGIACSHAGHAVVVATPSQVHWLRGRDLAWQQSCGVADRIVCVPPQISRVLPPQEEEEEGALVGIAHARGLALRVVPRRGSPSTDDLLYLPGATWPLMCCEVTVDTERVLVVVCGASLWLVGRREGMPGVVRLAILPLEDTALHSVVADGCVLAVNRVCGRVLVVRITSRRQTATDPPVYSLTPLADLPTELPVLGLHLHGPALAQPSDRLAVQLVALPRHEARELHCLTLQLPSPVEGLPSSTEAPAIAWTRYRAPPLLQSGLASVSSVHRLTPEALQTVRRLCAVPVVPLVRVGDAPAAVAECSLDCPPLAWRITCSTGQMFVVHVG